MFTVWKEVVGWLTDTRSITYTWKFQLAYFYRAPKALFIFAGLSRAPGKRVQVRRSNEKTRLRINGCLLEGNS